MSWHRGDTRAASSSRTANGRGALCRRPSLPKTGVGSRMYSIDNVLDRKGKRHFYRFTSYQRTIDPKSPSVRIAMAGTGGLYLFRKARQRREELRSLLRAHDHCKVSTQLIADWLAGLNYEVHENVNDGTVGPRSIVVWSPRPGSRRQLNGGHHFYTETTRDASSEIIPTIHDGMDIGALGDLLMTSMGQRLATVNPADLGTTALGIFGFDSQDELSRRCGNSHPVPMKPCDEYNARLLRRKRRPKIAVRAQVPSCVARPSARP